VSWKGCRRSAEENTDVCRFRIEEERRELERYGRDYHWDWDLELRWIGERRRKREWLGRWRRRR